MDHGCECHGWTISKGIRAPHYFLGTTPTHPPPRPLLGMDWHGDGTLAGGRLGTQENTRAMSQLMPACTPRPHSSTRSPWQAGRGAQGELGGGSAGSLPFPTPPARGLWGNRGTGCLLTAYPNRTTADGPCPPVLSILPWFPWEARAGTANPKNPPLGSARPSQL